MSAGEQFLGSMIDSFGGLVTLFFTSFFGSFIAPLFVTIAGWFGLAPVT